VLGLDVSDGRFRQEVVGEASYQPDLRRLAAQQSRHEIQVLLLPEPTNRHDRNAVRVVATNGDCTIGYLPREDAAMYQSRLTELQRLHHRVAVCKAVLVGAERELGNIGVWLDCDLDMDLTPH